MISHVHLCAMYAPTDQPTAIIIIIIIKRKAFALDWAIYRICIHIQV